MGLWGLCFSFRGLRFRLWGFSFFLSRTATGATAATAASYASASSASGAGAYASYASASGGKEEYAYSIESLLKGGQDTSDSYSEAFFCSSSFLSLGLLRVGRLKSTALWGAYEQLRSQLSYYFFGSNKKYCSNVSTQLYSYSNS